MHPDESPAVNPEAHAAIVITDSYRESEANPLDSPDGDREVPKAMMTTDSEREQEANPAASENGYPETDTIRSSILTDDEIRAFVGANSDYYVGAWRPTSAGQGRSFGFNVGAFFFCGLWLGFRKMYQAMFILMAVVMLEMVLEDILLFSVLKLQKAPRGLDYFFMFVICTVIAVCGNRWYFSRAKRVIEEVRARGLPEEAHLNAIADQGGTSILASLGLLLLFFLGMMMLMVLTAQFLERPPAGGEWPDEWGVPQWMPHVQHGNITVSYTQGATKAEADRLGAYLVKKWGAQISGASVEIRRMAGDYQIRMVVKKEFQNDVKMLRQLEFDGARISRDVFAGAAVEVHACNEYWKTLRVVPPHPDLRYGVVEKTVEVFHSAAIDKSNAERLAKFFVSRQQAAQAAATIKLVRRGEIVEIHMTVKAQLEGKTLKQLEFDGARISRDVFAGAAVEVHACDEYGDIIKVIRPRADLRYGVVESNVEVFYSAAVDKGDAQQLGQYFAKDRVADSQVATLKLARRGAIVEIHMVIEPDLDEKTLKGLEFDSARISRDVFAGAAVEMHACDEYLNSLKVYQQRADLRYGIAEDNIEVYYSAPIEKSDAQRFARYILDEQGESPAVAAFKLARRGKIVEVHMIFNREAAKDPMLIAAMRAAAKDFTVNVFNNDVVEIHLCDEFLVVFQVVKPLTDS